MYSDQNIYSNYANPFTLYLEWKLKNRDLGRANLWCMNYQKGQLNMWSRCTWFSNDHLTKFYKNHQALAKEQYLQYVMAGILIFDFG